MMIKMPSHSLVVVVVVVTALALALEFVHGSPMQDRPSMLCDVNGLTSLSSSNHPGNPRNTDFQICYPTTAHHESVAMRSLEATDANMRNQSEGIRRLQEFFNATFEFNVSRLAFQHFLETPPWPGSYWPTSKDGINHRWDPNQPSPSEKYAMAFGKSVRKMQDLVSRNSGIDSYATNPKCRIKPGEALQQGTCATGAVCSTRRGELNGYCIGSWEGICHAWAPASMLEAEPQCPVTKNGVKFEVLDIKGLLTQVYYDSSEDTVFTGARFDGNESDPATAAKEQYGRFVNDARRDLGPGYFHLAITNVLGGLNMTVILDVVSGSQVWNHALMGFQITDAKVFNKPAEAAKIYFNADDYPFNDAAIILLYIKNRVQYMTESDENGPLLSSNKYQPYVKTAEYEYLLELDRFGNVIGGEWVGNSRDDHPDFLWVQMSKPEDDFVAPSSGIQYGHVRELLEESIRCNQTRRR